MSVLLSTEASFPGAVVWVHRTELLPLLFSGGSLASPEPLGLSASSSPLKVRGSGGACRAPGLLGGDQSEPLMAVARRPPCEVGPGPELEASSPCGWVPSDQAVRMGWEAVPVGMASRVSSSVWMELLCHRVPPRSPSPEAVVGRGLLAAMVLVPLEPGTVGVGSVLGPDVGGMGCPGSCSEVGSPFPLETVPLLGFRALRPDGHCWRPHRARLLGFLVTSQGSSWFLAQVTLRVRTPPPQETEHWKRGQQSSPGGAAWLTLRRRQIRNTLRS